MLPPLIFRITLREGMIVVVISQMSKLRPREAEWPSWGHSARPQHGKHDESTVWMLGQCAVTMMGTPLCTRHSQDHAAGGLAVTRRLWYHVLHPWALELASILWLHSCQNEGPRLSTGATVYWTSHSSSSLEGPDFAVFFPFQHLSCLPVLPFPPLGESAAQFFKKPLEGAPHREMGESPPGLSWRCLSYSCLSELHCWKSPKLKCKLLFRNGWGYFTVARNPG